MAAALNADEAKEDENINDNSSMNLSIQIVSKKLKINVSDQIKKRAFKNELSRQELIAGNFQPSMSLIDIRDTIKDAFKGDDEDISLKIGYQEAARKKEGEAIQVDARNHDDDEIIEMPGLSDVYSSGNEMILKITEKIRRRTVDYFCPVKGKCHGYSHATSG